jgi:hypothetical protein
MSTTQNEFVQQPLDVGIYEMDWAARYLAGTGDTAGNLLAFGFTSNTDGFVATSQTAIGQPVPGGVLRVRASGGVSGADYKVTARIGTVQGRTREWDITVIVMAA